MQGYGVLGVPVWSQLRDRATWDCPEMLGIQPWSGPSPEPPSHASLPQNPA